MKILISGNVFSEKTIDEFEKRGFSINLRRDFLKEDDLAEEIRDVDAYILGGDEKITQKVVSGAKNLKIIAFLGVGPETFFQDGAISMLSKRGVPVAITPAANMNAVAEATVALILESAKKITHLNNLTKAGKWQQLTTAELLGKTIGVVGMGRVGGLVLERLSGFGMKVLYTNPELIKEINEKFGATHFLPEKLHDVLRQADIITLHAPLLAQTKHMIGKKEFGVMKNSAILINTARPQLVNPEALYDALVNNKITFAAFDGYYQEPADPKTDPHKLLSLGNDKFIVTPHQAFNTIEANQKTSQMAYEAVMAVFSNKKPQFVANPEYLKFKK